MKKKKKYKRYIRESNKVLSDYITNGIEGKDWYNDLQDFLRPIFNEDTDLFIDLLSATSINTTVAANVTIALKAYKAIKAGKANFKKGYLPIQIKQINQVLEGKGLTGDKLQNFSKAMKGDQNAIVIDRWMYKAFKAKPGNIAREKIKARIRNLAKQHGYKPAEVQAMIWTGIKVGEKGSRGDVRGFKEILLERM